MLAAVLVYCPIPQFDCGDQCSFVGPARSSRYLSIPSRMEDDEYGSDGEEDFAEVLNVESFVDMARLKVFCFGCPMMSNVFLVYLRFFVGACERWHPHGVSGRSLEIFIAGCETG